MKKILSVALISALALMLSTGCSSKSDTKPANAPANAPAKLDPKVSKGALYVKTHDNKKIAHAIEKAGEKTGWKITKFKSNEVIAEKTTDGDTVSSNVHFYDGHIEFSNKEATMDLRNAIEAECNKSSSSAH